MFAICLNFLCSLYSSLFRLRQIMFFFHNRWIFWFFFLINRLVYKTSIISWGKTQSQTAIYHLFYIISFLRLVSICPCKSHFTVSQLLRAMAVNMKCQFYWFYLYIYICTFRKMVTFQLISYWATCMFILCGLTVTLYPDCRTIWTEFEDNYI